MSTPYLEPTRCMSRHSCLNFPPLASMGYHTRDRHDIDVVDNENPSYSESLVGDRVIIVEALVPVGGEVCTTSLT